jgi:hypothetical protein
LTAAERAWIGLAAGLCIAALAARLSGIAPVAIDWQPARALTEPWRAFSAVAVHYSNLHLVANLAGAALVAALGAAAGVSPAAVAAWACAWPLTQLGLLVRPDLAHSAGCPVCCTLALRSSRCTSSRTVSERAARSVRHSPPVSSARS